MCNETVFTVDQVAVLFVTLAGLLQVALVLEANN